MSIKFLVRIPIRLHHRLQSSLRVGHRPARPIRLGRDRSRTAVPAKAGTHLTVARAAEKWTPAFAGEGLNIFCRHKPVCFLSAGAKQSRAVAHSIGRDCFVAQPLHAMAVSIWSKSALAFAAALVFATGAIAQTSQPEVTNAWARATPGKAENGAAYLTLQSPTPDRLVSISTPVAKKAELHTMSMSGGIMQMRPVAGIDVPAGQPVTLKPGGEHVMLLGLSHPLQEGQSFPLTLTFEKGGTRTVDVAIEKAGAAGPAHAAKH